jgi:XTP/dITP diphosphohydrolase
VAGRLVLLGSSPRVAAGLLSRDAWTALAEADAVLVGAPDHPQAAALRDAGVEVREVETPEGEDPSTVHARTLLAESLDGTVVWLLDPGETALADAVLARAGDLDPDELPEVVLLPGSWDLPGARLLDLVAVMDRLRSPGGCPWDARQTHESLVEYLVEEAYETVEAIERGDDDELREELGDLLLQVVFHARIAEERSTDAWSVDDVAAGIVAKLVSRHPHVFGDVGARTAEQVEEAWAELKKAEKGRESVTDGIPLALPALVLAAKLLRRSEPVPVDPVAPQAADAVRRALEETGGDYGTLLLAAVALSRVDDVDAEAALRGAVRDLRERVRTAEGLDPDRLGEG